MIDGNTVRVTVSVAVEPDLAFQAFTDEIDAWWRRDPRFRGAPGDESSMRFEPGAAGRLVEVDQRGTIIEIGQILVWEPGARLTFEWHPRSFGPDQTTVVDVCFEPIEEGTRLTLEHRGWEADLGAALRSQVGLWWSDLLTPFRRHVDSAIGRSN